MKKILALVTITALCIAFLVGCNSQNSPEPSIAGETHDEGGVNLFVPTDWKIVSITNFAPDDSSANKHSTVTICKGGESSTDLYEYPNIQISYFKPDIDMVHPSPSWYDNIEELTPTTFGDKTWEGFSGENLGAKFDIMWTGKSGDNQYQVTLWKELENGTISLDDADVKAIIASIKPSA